MSWALVSCSKADHLELPGDYTLNWKDEEALKDHKILYRQLNDDPFLRQEVAGKSIEEMLHKDSLYTLDSKDKARLLAILSDSANFQRGECGTFALNAGLVFIQNDTLKGAIELGCGYYQWKFNPYNPYAVDGSLSRQGFENMTIMLDSIHAKMNRR